MSLYRLLPVTTLVILSFSFLQSVEAESEPDFSIDFSNGFIPQISKGLSQPIIKNGVEVIESKLGPSIKSGLVDSALAYSAEGNIGNDSGTVSMWIEPEWDVKDGLFHMFFTLLGDGRLSLYKHGGSNTLVLGYTAPAEYGRSSTILSAETKSWHNGEPNHVAASWEPGLIRLFMNGELMGSIEDPNIVSPRITPQSVFFIGDYYSPSWGTQTRLSGVADTAISDVRLYPEALGIDAIRELSKKKQPTEGLNSTMKENERITSVVTDDKRYDNTLLPKVVVPLATKKPEIDGSFSREEWSSAVAFTGLLDLGTGALAEQQAAFFLTYDESYLYVASLSPLPLGGVPKADATSRDGQTWCDDSIELHFDPAAAMDVNKNFQWVVNSKATVYDARFNDPQWNSHADVRAGIDHNWQGMGLSMWFVEMRIPFSDFGIKQPKVGDRWRANFARTWIEKKVLLTAWGGRLNGPYNDPAAFGWMEFGEAGPAIQWVGLKDVDTGSPVASGYWSGNEEASIAFKEVGNVLLPPTNDGAETWKQEIDLSAKQSRVLSVDFHVPRSSKHSQYSAAIPFQIPEAKTRIYLKQAPSTNSLSVQVNPLKFRQSWAAGWLGVCEISDAKKNTLLTQSQPHLKSGFLNFDFNLATLSPGNYTAKICIKNSDNIVVADEEKSFVKSELPNWKKYPVGLEGAKDVLYPWTPVEVTESPDTKSVSMEVWGRSIVFDREIFPRQITSRSTELFARPVNLVANGVPFNAGDSLSIVEKSSGEVLFKAHDKTQNIEVTAKLEFDGMLWYEVTLGAGQYESLCLDVPLRDETSTLYHVSSGDWAMGSNRPGLTPEKWGDSWKQCLWLGNEDVGFSWFAESDQYWNLQNHKDALSIEKIGGERRLRVNFINKPTHFNSPSVFRFGVQATPMRPEIAGWRNWKFPSTGGYDPKDHNPEAVTTAISWWMNWSPKISSPFDALPNMREHVEGYHANQIKVIPYNAFQAVNENAPYADEYKAEWLVTPTIDAGGERNQRLMWVSLKSSFSDYFLYGLKNLAKNGGWDGIYFDFCQGARPDTNELHDSGYVDDSGVRKPTYDILAQRDFLKRLIRIFQQDLGIKDPIIMGHMTANKLPPVHSFVNVHFDGEQYKHTPKVDDDYTKVLSIDTYRAEFLGRQFGAVPVFLPQLGPLHQSFITASDEKERGEKREKFRRAIDTMLIFPLLHGTLLTPYWLDQEYVQPILKRWSAFPDSETRFIGYWEKADVVSVSPQYKDVKASIYLKERHALVILANLSEDSKECTVALSLGSGNNKATGDPALSFTSIFGDVPGSASAQSFKITLRPKSVTVVEAK